jgi:hypothetical protein
MNWACLMGLHFGDQPGDQDVQRNLAGAARQKDEHKGQPLNVVGPGFRIDESLDYQDHAQQRQHTKTSTVLNEAQFNRDWIEMQLAHADNTVRGVYNAAEWLSGRRTMLQLWADYLEAQRVGSGS